MATFSPINLAAHAAQLTTEMARTTEAAIAAAKVDTERTEAELAAKRAKEAKRHETAVLGGYKGSETRRENTLFAPMKAEYDALYLEAFRLQGEVTALIQVCNMAAYSGSFSPEATLRLEEKKAEAQKRFDNAVARGRELNQKLPLRLRASSTYEH